MLYEVITRGSAGNASTLLPSAVRNPDSPLLPQGRVLPALPTGGRTRSVWAGSRVSFAGNFPTARPPGAGR